jgi:hypothetical protein
MSLTNPSYGPSREELRLRYSVDMMICPGYNCGAGQFPGKDEIVVREAVSEVKVGA